MGGGGCVEPEYVLEKKKTYDSEQNLAKTKQVKITASLLN
jgi:hypothetical protein